MKRIGDFALGAFLAALGLWVLGVSLPHTFQPGEEIKASEMNDNFEALRQAATANGERLSSVASGQKALPTAEGKLAYAYFGWDGSKWGILAFFNSTGGAVTAKINGTGDYDFTFEGFDLTGASIQLTPSRHTPRVCMLYTDIGNVAVTDTFNVRCYTLNGGSGVTSLAITVMK